MQNFINLCLKYFESYFEIDLSKYKKNTNLRIENKHHYLDVLKNKFGV